MIYGALYGLLAAFIIFAVTYLQASHDREIYGETEDVLRPYPGPTLLLILVCVGIGTLIGAYNG
jgi:cell division protein FtsX